MQFMINFLTNDVLGFLANGPRALRESNQGEFTLTFISAIFSICDIALELFFFKKSNIQNDKLQIYCIKFLGALSLNPQILHPYMFLL